MQVIGVGRDKSRYIVYDKGSSPNVFEVKRSDIIEYTRNHLISNIRICGRGVTEAPEIEVVRRICSADRDKIYSYLNYYTHLGDDIAHNMLKYISDNEVWADLVHNGYIGLLGNRYEMLFNIKTALGVDIITPSFLCNRAIKAERYIKVLSNKIKDSVVHLDMMNIGGSILSSPELIGFRDIEKSSNINPEYRYGIVYGGYITEYNRETVRDNYEKEILNKAKRFKLENIRYKNLTYEDMLRYIRNERNKREIFGVHWISENNISVLSGFRYFDPHTVNGKVGYLCAMYEGEIVGVIHYGTWRDNPYQSISYIDIHNAYKRKGIAKGLIKELNKYLDKSKPLVLTDVSEEGKAANMEEEFKRGIKGIKVCTYTEAIRNRKDFST